MDRKELSQVRHDLGKTQMQMAELLSVSVKSIQSIEQGWREVPDAVERDLLFFLGLKKAMLGGNCWSVKKCSKEIRRQCPVWEFQAGNLCWLFNVNLCQGKAPKSWDEKMKTCRKCEVFQSIFDLPGDGARNHHSNRNTRSASELAQL
jgi:hypothetical protein